MSDATFMADDAIDPSGKGSTSECRSRSASSSNCAFRSSSAIVAPVPSIGASSISLSGKSLSAQPSSRNTRSHSTGHLEATASDAGIAPQTREQQRSDHWSHRHRRFECLSPYFKKAWLNRVEKAAHFKSKLLTRLIACSRPNSPQAYDILLPCRERARGMRVKEFDDEAGSHLARLRSAAETLSVIERQKVVRLRLKMLSLAKIPSLYSSASRYPRARCKTEDRNPQMAKITFCVRGVMAASRTNSAAVLWAIVSDCCDARFYRRQTSPRRVPFWAIG